MKVVVVGCGYVGLVTAAGLASAGHRVVGIESDRDRLASVARGDPPFHEPGLPELLRSVTDAGSFEVSDELGRVVDADVVLLAVQTPPLEDGSVDLGYVRDAAARVAGELPRQGRRVVAVRSTVVPGTADSLAPLFGDDTAVASNPEFLQEGSAVQDFLRPDRVVIGAHETWARKLLSDLYAPLEATMFLTTPATAELAKYASNALLATLISFSNELASISETLADVDVEEVLGAVHLDRRLSPRVDGATITPGILSYLKAGCGYGGSCLPKDLSALVATRRAAGEVHPLLEAVQAVNDAQPGRVADILERRLGPLTGRSIGVLGLAFKAGTDDVRSSPALRIVDELLERGASVLAYDPLVRPEALAAWQARGLRLADGVDELLAGVEGCLIATGDRAFSDAAGLAAAHGTVLLDGRRLLPVERLGDLHLAVGRAAPQPAGDPPAAPGTPTST